MITPAISVWISSSAENIVNKSRSLLQPRSTPGVIRGGPPARASGRLEGWKQARSLFPPFETLGVARRGPQGDVELFQGVEPACSTMISAVFQSWFALV